MFANGEIMDNKLIVENKLKHLSSDNT